MDTTKTPGIDQSLAQEHIPARREALSGDQPSMYQVGVINWRGNHPEMSLDSRNGYWSFSEPLTFTQLQDRLMHIEGGQSWRVENHIPVPVKVRISR